MFKKGSSLLLQMIPVRIAIGIIFLLHLLSVTASSYPNQLFTTSESRYDYGSVISPWSGGAPRTQAAYQRVPWSTANLPEYGSYDRASRRATSAPPQNFRGGMGRYLAGSRPSARNFGVYSTTTFEGRKPVYTVDTSKFSYGWGQVRTNSLITLQFQRNPNVGIGKQAKRVTW